MDQNKNILNEDNIDKHNEEQKEEKIELKKEESSKLSNEGHKEEQNEELMDINKKDNNILHNEDNNILKNEEYKENNNELHNEELNEESMEDDNSEDNKESIENEKKVNDKENKELTPEQCKANFYLRYNIGHKGVYGFEFLEFEFKSDGRLRYANNSNYKDDCLIRKEVYCNQIVTDELIRIILESDILKQSDFKWPKASFSGSQELEIIYGKEHISFATAKIGSTYDINKSADPKGLSIFYYLVQNIKCFILSIISMHFRIKPI